MHAPRVLCAVLNATLFGRRLGLVFEVVELCVTKIGPNHALYVPARGTKCQKKATATEAEADRGTETETDMDRFRADGSQISNRESRPDRSLSLPKLTILEAARYTNSHLTKSPSKHTRGTVESTAKYMSKKYCTKLRD